ncbi:MAG: ABC transporter ATP-binding protein [Kiritimatiellae bacterium]|nr:ABC transporter ATP-binding protein [Kiritimatiellia bacterium]
MDALKATGVRHAYGRGGVKTQVLADFALTLPSGAFEVLMGPSGSGKSTFLHLAAGLLVPEAGTIEIGGHDVTAMGDAAAAKFRRRHVGVVFQAFNLVDTLTVAENVALPLRLDHAKPDEDRLRTLLAKLGLEGKAGRRPDALSGGERQRVAFARALFAEPDVILADEPTGNLDVAAAKDICELLRTVNREEKRAILLVTHDPVVAAAATRVHFLRDGRIVATHETDHDPAVVSRLYLETYR